MYRTLSLIALLLTTSALAEPVAPVRPLLQFGSHQLRHPERIRNLSWSEDGSRLITTTASEIGLWEMPAGKLLHRLPFDQTVHMAGLSPDHRRLAVLATVENKLFLFVWDAETGAERFRTSAAGTFSFSPDSKRLAVVGGRPGEPAPRDKSKLRSDEAIRVLDASTGAVLEHLQPNERPVNALVWSGPPGGLLAVFEVDGRPHVELARPVAQQKDNFPVWGELVGRDARTMASRDGSRVAFVDNSTFVSVIDTKTGKRLCKIDTHGGSPLLLNLSPDGQRLLVGDHLGDVRVYDAGTGTERLRLDKQNPEFPLAISPDGKHFAIGGMHAVRFLDAKGQPTDPFPGHRDGVRQAAFVPSQRAVATASWGVGPLDVRLWNIQDGKLLRQVYGTADEERPAFSADGQFMATLNIVTGEATVRDVGTGRAVTTVKHDRFLLSVALSPDGRRLATGGDRSASVWDTGNGKRLHSWAREEQQPAEGLVFSPDGRTLAIAGGGVRLIDVASGLVVRPPFAAGASGRELAFSPNGRLLTVWKDNRVATVWEVASGKPVTTVASADNHVWTANGRIVSGGRGPTRLHDLSTGCSVANIGDSIGEAGVAISQDGTRALTWNTQWPSATLWDVSSATRAVPKKGEPAPAEHVALWMADLEGDNSDSAERAWRAVWRLSANADQAVPLLAKRIATRDDPERADKLVRDLGADRFADRERAERELIALGATAEGALVRARKGEMSKEQQVRLDRVLTRLYADANAAVLSREGRILTVLELSGTMEARRLLRELANGDPDRSRTQAAKAALRRNAGLGEEK